MQALPAVQSAPQNQAPSSASQTDSGSDFKSVLAQQSGNAQSSTAQGAKGSEQGNSSQGDKNAAQPDNAQDGKQTQAQSLPSILAAVSGEKPKAENKSEKKPDAKQDAKQDAKTDPTALAIPFAAANMPVQPAKAGDAKQSDSDNRGKITSLDGASRKANLASQQASKPAEIAQTGNNLPPKQIKVADSRGIVEKPVLPDNKKASENQISLQADTSTQDTKSVPKLTVNTPVSSPQWGSEVGQKIAWMSSSGNHVAELHLNPPNLGPVEVKLTIHNDQATVQFVAQHHEACNALESALPKLKEMMMESGIALGNATVNSGSSQQQSGFSQQEQPKQQHALQAVAAPMRMGRTITNLGNIDTFA